MNRLIRLLGVLPLGFLALTANLHAIDELFSDEEIANSFTLPEVDEPPQPTKQVEPDLSKELQSVNGFARVGFLVDEGGSVIAPRVQKSSDPRFDQPAMDAIERWKFKPAKKGGKAVSVRVILPFRFTSK